VSQAQGARWVEAIEYRLHYRANGLKMAAMTPEQLKAVADSLYARGQAALKNGELDYGRGLLDGVQEIARLLPDEPVKAPEPPPEPVQAPIPPLEPYELMKGV
jgi:hypothetical protein